MNAFAAAAAVLFNDPNGSISGIYTPTGGQPIPVRILRVGGTDRVAGSLAQFGVQAEQERAEVQVAEVPLRPVAGALLTFDGQVRRVDAAAAPARNGLTWSMALATA